MIKILNFSNKFAIGKRVVAIKEFKNGSLLISVGDEGIIDKVTIESFPDIGLFNLKILHIDFGNKHLSMGEEVAEGYFNII